MSKTKKTANKAEPMPRAIVSNPAASNGIITKPEAKPLVQIGEYTRKGLGFFRACYVQDQRGVMRLKDGIIIREAARNNVPTDIARLGSTAGYNLEVTDRQVLLWQRVGTTEYLLGMAQGGRGTLQSAEPTPKPTPSVKVFVPKAAEETPKPTVKKFEPKAKPETPKVNQAKEEPKAQAAPEQAMIYDEPEYLDCEPVWEDQY